LHRAAFGALGLDWTYEAAEVVGAELGGFMAGLDESWRGLSLTMPLKRDVLPLLDHIDDLVELTGVANTVLLDGGQRHGFNTDVFGIAESLHFNGVTEVRSAIVLGGGATAASSIVALRLLGAERVDVLVRDAAKSGPLVRVAEALGVDYSISTISAGAPTRPVDVVVSTLPGGAVHGVTFDSVLRSKSTLLDVAYDPWPSALSTSWDDAGGRVVHGLEMLLFQAVGQQRVFVNGDPHTTLENEEDVIAAMRAAVGL
jgi:shikimate dehydrogenase